jgi:hypothetical protein
MVNISTSGCRYDNPVLATWDTRSHKSHPNVFPPEVIGNVSKSRFDGRGELGRNFSSTKVGQDHRELARPILDHGNRDIVDWLKPRRISSTPESHSSVYTHRIKLTLLFNKL